MQILGEHMAPDSDPLLKHPPAPSCGQPNGGGYWLAASMPLAERQPHASEATYGVSLVHMTAGVTTHAVVYRSADEGPYWASLGDGCFTWDEQIHLDVEHPPLYDVRLVPAPVTNGGDIETRARQAGYVPLSDCSALQGLLSVLDGESAGFLGHDVEPATRLATALLIAEARGFVSHWSGHYPHLNETSMIACAELAHYRSLLEIVDRAT
ncbi:hypothetical protein [Nonomuraea sp. NPDC049400]|uniref:hypothetical protein n=1 Tax=Nonomuraea sp. NPDC049400 TaxID=3364352 RepID=UPI0037B5812C